MCATTPIGAGRARGALRAELVGELGKTSSDGAVEMAPARGPHGPTGLQRLSTRGSVTDARRELLNLLVGALALLELVAHLVDGVDDRGVIPSTEAVPDHGEGEIGELAA
jgi:hypothetical protein